MQDVEGRRAVVELLTESVYGDGLHEDRSKRRDMLKETILDNYKRAGTLVIPTFSLERTQEIIFEIHEMLENKEIPKMPIYVDSPLGIKITEIYRTYTDYFNETVKEDMTYEGWISKDGTWVWLVLKKNQVDDYKPYASAFCAVYSPNTFGSCDMGDTYLAEIRANALLLMPDTAARPNAWVSWSTSARRSPGCAISLRPAGSTRMPFISCRSITSPPSHRALPATLWPPPRTATSSSCSRAKRRAAITSAVPLQRAKAAGRRSIAAFQILRTSS